MKRFLPLIVVVVLLSLLPSNVMAFGGCESDCMKCHDLKPSDARTVLEPLIPDVRVEKVSIAPAKGLWEILYTSNGKKNLAYLDFSLKNIIIGQIIEIKTKNNLTRDRLIQISRVDFSAIPLENSLVLGSADAKQKIVVFSDPDCPYCRKLHDEMVQVVGQQKDIAFFIKLYPLPMHKDARRKSESILCANSLSLLEEAYSQKKIPDPACNDAPVDANIALAGKLGITGTPALIFSDGSVVPGFMKSADIIRFVEKTRH